MFNERIGLLKQCSFNLIRHIFDLEGKIVAMGASTKGNMICQFLGLSSEHIKCVIDNNQKKIGKIMTGSNIPIVDEKDWISCLPKYILVLPYYYLDYFKQMVSINTQKDTITYLIVLIPSPKIIKVIGSKS
jgi:hypothetical protein